MASMVDTFLPRAAERGVLQARTGAPSSSTVQAPQRAMPQPYLVPVRCRWSRRTQRRGVSGAASTGVATPLMLRVGMIFSFIGGRTRDRFLTPLPLDGSAALGLVQGRAQRGGALPVALRGRDAALPRVLPEAHRTESLTRRSDCPATPALSRRCLFSQRVSRRGFLDLASFLHSWPARWPGCAASLFAIRFVS